MRKLNLPVDRIATLYVIGVPVERIAREIGTSRERVKGVVRREALKRDPSRYAEGVRYMAPRGVEFRPTAVDGYWVSDYGHVLAMKEKPGTVLKGIPDRDGYLRVKLWEGNLAKHALVHRLVAEAFHGKPGPDQSVAHNNGKRDDNRASNLRWATQVENVSDKKLHGTEQKGSKHGNASTDEEAIASVKRMLRRGETLSETAAATGVSFHVVADVSRGRTWRHVP